MSLLKKSVNGARIELSTVHAHILSAGENASVCFCYAATTLVLKQNYRYSRRPASMFSFIHGKTGPQHLKSETDLDSVKERLYDMHFIEHLRPTRNYTCTLGLVSLITGPYQ